MTIERAAREFRQSMEDLGLGVTLHIPGHDPVVVTEPREKSMSAATIPMPQQLSFDVGGEAARPTGASIAITGKGDIRSQLFIDDDVTVRVIDARGEIVASFEGAVVDIGFKKHDATETTGAWVERIHKIKLGARED